jgi:haloalkane dehalogenase
MSHGKTYRVNALRSLKKGTENTMISATFPYQKKRQLVLGQEMAYVEVGNGDPIVFLHGNPTSSYLWRNIIPYLEDLGRCIAPDLIGMGDSDKLPNSGPNSYTFIEHRRYLDALLDLLGVHQRVTFVVHDWGSALGFDWAYRHPDAVRGIAYMEAIVKPGTWSEMSEPARKIFQALRSPAGEQMVLEQNSFIEVNLPNTILRSLTEEEMNTYRRPFAEPGEARRPTLTWPRQLPFDGEPADVTEIVTTYGKWLAQSSIPKLYIKSDPGTMLPSAREFCRAWPAQSEVTVRARHYPQEDSPDEVGQAIANWLQHLT